MNDLVKDPFKLQAFLNDNDLLQGVELKVMLSGDSWSSDSGFDLSLHNKCFFENKEIYIEKYYNNIILTNII